MKTTSQLEAFNYYERLGVKKNASEEDIKTAYRQLARIYHPDMLKSKFPKESDRMPYERAFLSVKNAYDILLEQQSRRSENKPVSKADSRPPSAHAPRAASIPAPVILSPTPASKPARVSRVNVRPATQPMPSKPSKPSKPIPSIPDHANANAIKTSKTTFFSHVSSETRIDSQGRRSTTTDGFVCTIS